MSQQIETTLLWTTLVSEALAQTTYRNAKQTRNAMKGLSQEATLDLMVGVVTGVSIFQHCLLEAIQEMMDGEKPKAPDEIEAWLESMVIPKMAQFAEKVVEIRSKATEMDLAGGL